MPLSFRLVEPCSHSRTGRPPSSSCSPRPWATGSEAAAPIPRASCSAEARLLAALPTAQTAFAMARAWAVITDAVEEG
jgi:hypothetical protein